MFTIVCWKWKQDQYRSKFDAKNVHILQNMISRNLSVPHRFVCITDDKKGLECETIDLWNEPGIMLGNGRPNCYRRLKLFSKDAHEIIGCRPDDHVLSIDLDTVIVDDFSHLIKDVFEQNLDFKIWGDTAPGTPYNGSLWMLRLNSRKEVWSSLLKAGDRAPILTKQKKFIGSDQAWMSFRLGGNEPRWTKEDGVYSFRNHLSECKTKDDLPNNTKIVFFHGKEDPWSESIRKNGYEWVIENYR